MVNKKEMIENRIVAEETDHFKKGQMKRQVSGETTEVKTTEAKTTEGKTTEETMVLIHLTNTSRSNVTSTTLTVLNSWASPSLSTGSLSPQWPF